MPASLRPPVAASRCAAPTAAGASRQRQSGRTLHHPNLHSAAPLARAGLLFAAVRRVIARQVLAVFGAAACGLPLMSTCPSICTSLNSSRRFFRSRRTKGQHALGRGQRPTARSRRSRSASTATKPTCNASPESRPRWLPDHVISSRHRLLADSAVRHIQRGLHYSIMVIKHGYSQFRKVKRFSRRANYSAMLNRDLIFERQLIKKKKIHQHFRLPRRKS